MSSSRSQTTEIKSDNEKPNSTHWVCCIANEFYMKEQADLLIGFKNSGNEKYQKIELKALMFKSIKNIDTLHIYGHGKKGEDVVCKGETDLDPKDFLVFLKDNGLDSDHKYLEIDACYSDQFAKKFAEVAKSDYPNLRVIGYPGQFVPCQGNNGENLANLEEPLVIQHKGRWFVNGKKLNKDNISEYYAEKHRKDFYTNPEKRHEFTELKSVNAAISSATTSDPNVISHPYQTRRASTSSYTDYESRSRESLPGRKSWSEILAQVALASAVEILENKSVTDQLVALNITEPSRKGTQSNATAEELNSSTSIPKLNLEKSKIDDIIADDEDNPSPTPRK